MPGVETIFAHLKATARKLAGATALDVAIVDGSGNHVTTFGGTGGTSSSFSAAFPATGTAAGFQDTGGNMAPGNLDASGNLKVAGTLTTTPPASATSALSSVAASAASTTVLASNALRLAFTLYNDSDSAVFVKLGATASSTSFFKKMLPYETLTTRDLGVNYTGRIDGIWDSATGNMRVTELTA